MNDTDPAFGIPRLVFIHGRAREMVEPKMRSLVEIAAEVLTDETQRIGISYTGFCLTALPHKRLPNDAPWEKKGHMVTLLVEPGRLRTGGRTRLHGVPYGARARIILLYLQRQAIRSGSQEVALGRSMRDWMERMRLAVGGETAKALREQAARISACSLKFFWDDGASDGFSRSAISAQACGSTPRTVRKARSTIAVVLASGSGTVWSALPMERNDERARRCPELATQRPARSRDVGYPRAASRRLGLSYGRWCGAPHSETCAIGRLLT